MSHLKDDFVVVVCSLALVSSCCFCSQGLICHDGTQSASSLVVGIKQAIDLVLTTF